MPLINSEEQLFAQALSTQQLHVCVRPFFWFASNITWNACSGFSWPEPELRLTPDYGFALSVVTASTMDQSRWDGTGARSGYISEIAPVKTEYRSNTNRDCNAFYCTDVDPVKLHPFHLRLNPFCLRLDRRRHNMRLSRNLHNSNICSS